MLVLQTLYDEPLLTRADLSRRTGLTRVTVSDLVAELIADDLVAEAGTTTGARPGKPATMLTVRDDSCDIVALDLSAPQSISGGVYTPLGSLRRVETRELGDAIGEDAYGAVASLVADLVARSRRQLLGVGVGTPGIVDSSGRVVTAPNLGWRGLPLQERLARRVDVPVIVENDANVAVLAESRFSGGSDTMLRVQIRRGVGAGLLIRGAIVVGTTGSAGEIGHMVIEPDGRLCRCGKAGCLETWAAAPALRARIAAEPDRREAVLAEAGARLGQALAPLVAALDLTDVVLGGDPEHLGGAFLASAQDVINELTRSPYKPDLRLRLSSLGDDAVVLGAVALVLRSTLGVT